MLHVLSLALLSLACGGHGPAVVPVFRAATVQFEVRFESGAGNPWVLTDCNAQVRGPASSHHPSMVRRHM